MNIRKKMENFSQLLDLTIILVGLVTFGYWFSGKGLFYSDSAPVMSPFTSFSLILMAGSRLAEKRLDTWSKPMTLAILGIVACGNFSSLWIHMAVPELFLQSMSSMVVTSAMTSAGLIAFCFYEILVVIRKTPDSALIIDDILLHLALFPGGLSLLGHLLNIPTYIGSSIDPRVGIGVMEMMFMGSYAVVAVISNQNLFLWRFLAHSKVNRFAFALLFVNQYIAPVLVGLFLRDPSASVQKSGIEYYVMLAGVLATLIFLVINAVCKRCSSMEEVTVVEGL